MGIVYEAELQQLGTCRKVDLKLIKWEHRRYETAHSRRVLVHVG